MISFSERRGCVLTQVGLQVGVDVEVFAPLHHALEDGHQTLQTLLTQTQLLQKQQSRSTVLLHPLQQTAGLFPAVNSVNIFKSVPSHNKNTFEWIGSLTPSKRVVFDPLGTSDCRRVMPRYCVLCIST